MRILFIINTPAQVYTWQHVIETLRDNNHTVGIIARDYGPTCGILKTLGFDFSVFKPKGSRYSRLLTVLDHFQKCYGLAREFDPALVIGFGIDASVTAIRLGRQSIIFTDGELSFLNYFLTRASADAIVTPDNSRRDWGKKHVPVAGYKEFAYLHPDYFRPDMTVLSALHLEKDEKYVILRFNSFDAIHDIGKHGFSLPDKFALVEELGKYARVFISPEGPLPEKLEKYRLPIPQTRIHHALYYAQLLVTDTQTMTTESAILGTPAVRSNNFVGDNDMRNFIELEKKYSLIFCFKEPAAAINKALELIQVPDLKARWAQKRSQLLSDKINVTRFMVDLIENYPDNFAKSL